MSIVFDHTGATSIWTAVPSRYECDGGVRAGVGGAEQHGARSGADPGALDPTDPLVSRRIVPASI